MKITLPKTIAAGAVALLLSAQPGFADDDDHRNRSGRNAQDLVEDLPVCYALGTDALGRAVDAMDDQPLDSRENLSDPIFREGLAFYRKCFTKDFTFRLTFDGGPPVVTVPDPLTRTSQTDAALEWANFVNNAFRPFFRNTQHHMGSIRSSVRGNRGSVQSYLIATHAYLDPALGVRVVGGTYTDRVVRRHGRWLIQSRTLDITSSVEVPAGLVPPAP